MDWILLVLAIIIMLVGLIGCIVPVLPGPPISYLGIIVLHLTRFADFPFNFLLILGIITVIVFVVDYIVPMWGVKKFGGSKAGIIGATIGFFAGMIFFPPIGMIVGVFLGAVVAEYIKNKDTNKSLKSGLGSLIGFLFGTGLKLALSFVMIYYFIKELI
ncbi:MAG: DUF456 domain-containing protein [Bacteroidetes bacterium]|nr:MAG: DUF456 domain-containing protein [Bacteroidota bacterium]